MKDGWTALGVNGLEQNDCRTTGETNGLIDEIHDMPEYDLIRQARLLSEKDATLCFPGVMQQLLDLSHQTHWYKNEGAKAYLKVQSRLLIQLMSALQDMRIDMAECRKMKVPYKGTKYVDIYRKYASALHDVANSGTHNSATAREFLNDLYLEQTVGEVNLDPIYVDGYTGEELTNDDIGIEDWKTRPEMPTPKREVLDRSVETAVALGWSEKTREQFIKAQGGYSDDLEEHHDDDRGWQPTTLDKDIIIDPEIWSMYWVMKDWNSAKQTMFQYLKDSKKKWMPQWLEARDTGGKHGAERQLMLAHDALIRELERMGTIFNATSMVAFTLPFYDSDAKYLPDMFKISNIFVNTSSGGRIRLGEAVKEYHQDVLEAMSEYRPGKTSPQETPDQYDEWEQAFIKDYGNTMPINGEPVKTRSYNVGYLRAMGSGATIKEATAQATQEWRARKVGVKAIHGRDGLTLEDGRIVNWTVAKMKLCANELDLTKQRMKALHDKLVEMGINNNFVMHLRDRC